MQDLWKQVAEQYHVSAEEVQAEITKAIETGMQTAEHSVRRAWAEIPRRCDVPEPEEELVPSAFLYRRWRQACCRTVPQNGRNMP